MRQMQIEIVPSPTFQAVLDELNGLRTILFGPPLGSRILMNEAMHLRLAAHLNRIQQIAHEASRK